jgi:hypothetical protein
VRQVDREVQAFYVYPKGCQDKSGDPNRSAVGDDHGPTAVAWNDRRVGLNKVTLDR